MCTMMEVVLILQTVLLVFSSVCSDIEDYLLIIASYTLTFTSVTEIQYMTHSKSCSEVGFTYERHLVIFSDA